MPGTLPLRTTAALDQSQTQTAIVALFSMAGQRKPNQRFARQNGVPDTQADRRFMQLEFSETRHQTETVRLARAMALDGPCRLRTEPRQVCRRLKLLTRMAHQNKTTNKFSPEVSERASGPRQ